MKEKIEELKGIYKENYLTTGACPNEIFWSGRIDNKFWCIRINIEIACIDNPSHAGASMQHKPKAWRTCAYTTAQVIASLCIDCFVPRNDMVEGVVLVTTHPRYSPSHIP
jgi:hypothetical protein